MLRTKNGGNKEMLRDCLAQARGGDDDAAAVASLVLR